MSDENKDSSEPYPEVIPAEEKRVETEEETLKKELEEVQDKYLRVLAELENQRKRLQKEKTESVKYAVAHVIVEFLQPLDNFENALKFSSKMSDDVKQWAQGFQMILQQLKEVLTHNGVHPFDSVGKSFNHDDHEALEAVETTEAAPGTILEEFRRGYKMDNRTIRPAKVKVAKAPSENKSNHKEG